MITKESINSFFNSQNNLISQLANWLTILSPLSAFTIWIVGDLDRLWPFVAFLAIAASILMAISLNQTKKDLLQVNDALNTLYSRHCDLLSERVSTDVKNNPESFTVARIAAISGVMRTIKKDPKEIDEFIRRLSERPKE